MTSVDMTLARCYGAPMTPFAKYLKSRGGSITRANPELLRISKETGYAVETLYLAAVGRKGSKALEIAIGRYKQEPLRRKRRAN